MHRLRRWGVLCVLAAVLAAFAAQNAAASDSDRPAVAHASKATKTKQAKRAKKARTALIRKAKVRKAITRKAVRSARSRIGKPYGYGATGPGAFDCSGLTSWALNRAGVRIPRTSHAQATVGRRVKRSRIRPGDLVFFNTAGPGASHVGIATSRRTVVSATSSGGVRRHSSKSGYWGAHYVGARRVRA